MCKSACLRPNERAYQFWRKQGFTCEQNVFAPGCVMTKAQLGWLAMIGAQRHVCTGARPVIGSLDPFGRKAVIGTLTCMGVRPR